MTPRTGRHITVRASRGISEYLSPSLGTECGRAKMPDWSRLHQPNRATFPVRYRCCRGNHRHLAIQEEPVQAYIKLRCTQQFSVSESGIDAGQVISERANEGMSCKSLQYKELQN